MPNRSGKKRPRDLNQPAATIADATTGHKPEAQTAAAEKNPAAVALGRLGGKKGGKARADKLTPEERRAMARKAAAARWHGRTTSRV